MSTITYYTYEYPPICGTGPGNSIRLLSSSLVDKGFKIKVVTLKFGKYSSLNRYECSDRVCVYRLQLPINERLLFALQVGFFSNFNRKKVKGDIIHVMDSRAAAFVYKDNTPLIVNINDYIPSMVPVSPFKKYPWEGTDKRVRYFYENITKIYEFLSFKRADLMIANSNFTNDVVSSFYGIPKDKVMTIYRGIDLSEFKGSAKKDVDVLFVGGNIEKKGIKELIHATAILKKDFPNISVVAIGRCSDKYMAYLKDEVGRLGVSGNISFIYNLPHAELVDYYKRSRVYALPTYRESLSQTIIEAMAAKLPVVTTNVGGVPEIVSPKSSFLIPPYDSNALAQSVFDVLSNPSKARRMGNEGFSIVSKNFSLQNMVKNYIGVYDSFT